MHQLFIDQNVRIEVAWALREDGHEVVHASDADLERRLTFYRFFVDSSQPIHKSR